jgi:hypothetical protein
MIRQPRGRTAVRVGRQAKRAGPRRLAPSEQVLWRDVVPARHLGIRPAKKLTRE